MRLNVFSKTGSKRKKTHKCFSIVEFVIPFIEHIFYVQYCGYRDAVLLLFGTH